MLTKVTQRLRIHSVFNFTKNGASSDFVFTPKKKKTSRKNKPTQPAPEEVVTAKSTESSLTSDEQRRLEISQKIYESNPMSQIAGGYTVIDWLNNGGTIEDFASDKMKEYPLHISHWNPRDKGYVASER